MTDHRIRLTERLSGIELAEIKTLMLVKEVRSDQMQRLLDAKGVESLEQLDWLTARNFLYYLRSL